MAKPRTNRLGQNLCTSCNSNTPRLGEELCGRCLEAQEERDDFEGKLLALRGQASITGGATEHALDLIADLLEMLWRK
jgi:hypothetical protein